MHFVFASKIEFLNFLGWMLGGGGAIYQRTLWVGWGRQARGGTEATPGGCWEDIWTKTVCAAIENDPAPGWRLVGSIYGGGGLRGRLFVWIWTQQLLGHPAAAWTVGHPAAASQGGTMPMDLHRQPPLPPMIRSGVGSGYFLVRPHQLRRPCVTQPVDELCRVIILAGTVSHFQPHISSTF